jgi:hypothetical protein
MTHQILQFTSQHAKCAAWLFTAQGKRGRRPCVILAHGVGGVKEMRLDAYAERFAAAGYHALVFDYRHFGDSEGEPRQLLDIHKQQQDWQAAIHFVRSLPAVDPAKIVLWGSSLSGGHVIAVAAGDPQVAAVIAQVPHFSGPASLVAMAPHHALRLSAHAVWDLLRSKLGYSPHYLPAAADPGELGLMAAPGEATGFHRLIPETLAYDNRIAARFALDVSLYSPGKLMPKLRMPTLVQIGFEDATTPVDPVIRACCKTPGATLKAYPTGHFAPYVEPLFSTMVADQISFLRDVLD